jgi:SNF2 family DNA or RNA helicase
LHRRKQDCLDLPAKQRLMVPVELDEAAGRGFQHQLQRKVEDYRRRVGLGEVRRDAEALAVFTALRQIGADYKLPAAAALVGRLLAQGESVLLFCSFVASAQLLQDRLGGQLLTGQVPPHQRQSAVDAFQAGASRLLIATYGAGGKSAFNFDMLPKALRVEGSVGLVAPFFLAEFAVGLCVTYLLLMLLIFSFIC